MIVAVNVVGGDVGEGLGRARSMAVARVEEGEISSWQAYDVRWDQSHGKFSADGHGAHHTRIASFMKEHEVEIVVTGHAGPPMAQTLGQMDILMYQGATGDARQAALEAVETLAG